MAELGLDDVRRFAGDRLDDTDDAVLQELLDAALAAARRYCGWPVSPVVADEDVVVDGPGGRVLSLPTLNLIEVTAVVEDGVTLDVSKLDVSRRKGTVRKYPWGCWSHRDGAIAVTMTHGFTEAEAADWRRGVLRLVNLMSLEPAGDAGRDTPALKRKLLVDVEYEWYEKLITVNEQLAAIFAPYQILPSP